MVEIINLKRKENNKEVETLKEKEFFMSALKFMDNRLSFLCVFDLFTVDDLH